SPTPAGAARSSSISVRSGTPVHSASSGGSSCHSTASSIPAFPQGSAFFPFNLEDLSVPLLDGLFFLLDVRLLRFGERRGQRRREEEQGAQDNMKSPPHANPSLQATAFPGMGMLPPPSCLNFPSFEGRSE